MKVRFRAKAYKKDKRTMVDVFDHQTKQNKTMTLKEYHKKSTWYAYNGGVIFGHRIEDTS